jgi:acetyl-CoA/propionyl-CoA carboxylase biotin carboxyl carrier protein
MATALPFHRAVVRDEAFTADPFTIFTRWIETEFDNRIPPYSGETEALETGERQAVTVEVGGRRLEVVLPAGLAVGTATAGGAKQPKREKARKKAGATVSGDSVASPMQGTIVKVAVEEGQEVAEGETIVVLEAMKMEQPINAHRAGTVSGLSAGVGETVTNGTVICEIKD